MKKIALITMMGNYNFGNRLQNYASDYILKKYGFNVVTIRNDIRLNNKNKIINFITLYFRFIVRSIINCIKEIKDARSRAFIKFNKNIKKTFFTKSIYNVGKFDYYVVGSDQVWKPLCGRMSDMDLLSFVDNNKRISYAASFGISSLPEEYKEKAKKELSKFKAISVREDSGKKIVEDLTGRKDVEVLVDPTMLLTSEEWDKVSRKPKNLKSKKYILNYFLGNLSEERKNEINRIAKENDCDVINILDKNDPMYVSGPSEFLWLEKNAFLICTDSFHSSVFAVLYNRPFVVFDREDNNANMGSRIDTLLSKFELKDRRYNGKEITKENLNHDYSRAYEILEKEREKSDKFLRNALDIK